MELSILHRFFIWPAHINDKMVRIDPDQARHIEKVLRLAAGDTVQVFDGQGHAYEVCLGGRENGYLQAEIIREIQQETESPLRLCLVQGLAKADKMDSIVQKAVELGVYSIFPLISQHAVVKLEKERAEKKTDRWQIIAREACKQCRRNRVPEVHAPLPWTDMLKVMAGKPAILFYEQEEKAGLREILHSNRDVFLTAPEVYIIIGPEGGFAPEEAEAARAQGVYISSLGPRILRTETAGLAAASIIQYELADLG